MEHSVEMISPAAKKKHKIRSLKSSYNWRYSVIKKYRQRAQHFADTVQSLEEKQAWLTVVTWFDSILKYKHLYDGVLGLPAVNIEDNGEVSEHGQRSRA